MGRILSDSGRKRQTIKNIGCTSMMASRKDIDSDQDFPEALTLLLLSFIVCKRSMQGLIVRLG